MNIISLYSFIAAILGFSAAILYEHTFSFRPVRPWRNLVSHWISLFILQFPVLMHRLWHLRGFHPQHLHGSSSTRYLFPLVPMSRWIMNWRAFLHQWNSTNPHTLIMKFSAGRPNPYDIKLHIKNHWGLSTEPIIARVDPRHYLILPASYNDMVLAQAHEVHKIANCMFRLYRWTKNFGFGKYNTEVPVWVRLPNLHFVYFNPSFLHRIGNSIGKLLRQDYHRANLLCMPGYA